MMFGVPLEGVDVDWVVENAEGMKYAFLSNYTTPD